jgi:hypothetical protein
MMITLCPMQLDYTAAQLCCARLLSVTACPQSPLYHIASLHLQCSSAPRARAGAYLRISSLGSGAPLFRERSAALDTA